MEKRPWNNRRACLPGQSYLPSFNSLTPVLKQGNSILQQNYFIQNNCYVLIKDTSNWEDTCLYPPVHNTVFNYSEASCYYKTDISLWNNIPLQSKARLCIMLFHLHSIRVSGAAFSTSWFVNINITYKYFGILHTRTPMSSMKEAVAPLLISIIQFLATVISATLVGG